VISVEEDIRTLTRAMCWALTRAKNPPLCLKRKKKKNFTNLKKTSGLSRLVYDEWVSIGDW
jgi:hypothetical protein